jgi:hypothetical protein
VTAHTEASLFAALYAQQFTQGSATVRHASVGEPYLWSASRSAGRAQHSVRRIDALVIRRDLSKGDSLWAVEIKVTAADLRRELASPDKTQAWARYVHAFYFLVPEPLASLALDQVPTEYGVLVASPGGHGYRVARTARRNHEPDPLPLDTWRRLAAKLGERQYQEATGRRIR